MSRLQHTYRAIIGDNGDGKTTLFEALEWLFKTASEDKQLTHISEKRKSELEVGQSDDVIVNITFEHDGEKEIEKSFTFEKVSEDFIRIKDYKFNGYSIDGSERLLTRGDVMLNQCFEPVIRKYCLFKGENNLNVFDNETALKTLVDTFSGIKQFDELVEMTSNFEHKSANAANKELQNDKRVSNQAKELNRQLDLVSVSIQDIRKELKEKEISISDFTDKIELIEKNQETQERYQDIKDRIHELQEKKAKLSALSSCNYSTNLLDESWILRSFLPIIKEFSAKVSALSKEKRRLEKQETERRAKEVGEREAISKIQKLANDAVPLPWNLPDKETMQEMIDDEICKVCGRPAPKGSEAYHFMCQKLNEYLANISAQVVAQPNEEEEEQPLFPNSFINELHSRQIKLSGETEQEIAGISTTIADRLDFITKRKTELSDVTKQIQELTDEMNDLLMQSNLSAEILDKNIKDWKGFFEAKGRAEKRAVELNEKLKIEEENKANLQDRLSKLEPESTMTKVYQRVHTAFERIMKAFVNAKEQNVRNFLQTLEEVANQYLAKLNKNDFYGVIHIRKTIDNSARIELHSMNGGRIENPNGALKTTMYMSVLFAISQITTLKREQDYPLIFDAPTSSFGGFKEDTFYNVIDTIEKQCLIVTKDLLNVDKQTGEKQLDFGTINKLSCSVYRIEKVVPFNDKDLSTIQTIIKRIKQFIMAAEKLYDLWITRNPKWEKRYEDSIIGNFCNYRRGATSLGEDRGKIFGGGYEIYIIAFFIGLYFNERRKLIEDSQKIKDFGHQIQYWGDLNADKVKVKGRKPYPKLREYIFTALVARTDIDFIALEKGDMTSRKAVDMLMQTMEEYANWCFHFMEDKLTDDPNYYYRETAFLELFMAFDASVDTDEEDDEPEALD